MMRGSCLGILISLGAALAQPAFDVASVKQGGPVRSDGLIDINLGTVVHGTVTLTNTTLSECIRFAYGLTNEEQIAGPDWIRDRTIRFEIIAKAPPDTPEPQLLLMMQTLLNQRFHLEMHREPRRIRHYLLIVGKDGPKMPRAEGDGPSVRKYSGAGRLSYTHLPMNRLVVLLSRQLKVPVLNQTGLDGAYDVELNWTPDDIPVSTDVAPKADIFSGIQQQLGLKLETSKDPLEVLVVDRAEKVPVAN